MIESEEMGENSMERHRRPVKPRMNRSVSEEVLQIEREMNEGKHGSKPYMHGKSYVATYLVDNSAVVAK